MELGKLRLIFNRISLALILFFIYPVIASAAIDKFIVISDLHFDPFVGCNKLDSPCPIITELNKTNVQEWNAVFSKYSEINTHYGHDSDYQLFHSTLAELKTLCQQEKPVFGVILGDYMAHKFAKQYKKYSGDDSVAGYHAFVKKALQYMAGQLSAASSRTSFYLVLGNNDSYEGNYDVTPHGEFLKDSAENFKQLIRDKKSRKIFYNGFASNGYYSIVLSRNQKLILLNSVLFSAMHPNEIMQNAADEQFNWLQAELAEAKAQQQKVLIAFHIPPGIDSYTAYEMRYNLVRNMWPPVFWQENDNERFLALVRQYSTIISGILAGHIHADAFQLISTSIKNQPIPISYTPAISPIFGNNPGLKIYSYNPQSFQLVDFTTYSYTLNESPKAKWRKEYSFNAAYQPHCQHCSLINGMQRLTKNNALARLYQKYYSVGRNAQPIVLNSAWVPYYWCNVYNLDWLSYKNCLANK